MNVNEAIQEVVALARSELRRNNVTLRMEIEDDLSPVLGALNSSPIRNEEDFPSIDVDLGSGPKPRGISVDLSEALIGYSFPA